ncbi:MAG: hypothetical protein QM697_12025 [Lachnospiraceae bacterium]
MKRTVIRFGVFLAVFVISVAIVSKIVNRGNTDLTAEMRPATLPVLYMNVNDEYVNCLHGYMSEMEGNYLRGSLTPLQANRTVSIKADTYGAVISKVAYEVRSMDMKRLIEDTELPGFSYENDVIMASIPIKDLIEDDTEYMLVIKLTTGSGEEIRYYSRIINEAEIYLSEKMDFVKDFSAQTFDKEAAKSLVPYMESNSEGDNSSYGYVNIHSSFNQLTWGELQPAVVTEKDLDILEIDALNASMKLSYQVSVQNELYNITEFFRIRRGSERIYLMEYERYMDQIFDEDKNVLVNGKILHGIMNEDLQYMENSDASVYCFVQQNALYTFNTSTNNLAKLYSFWDKENDDARTRYDAHGIKLLSVDEPGNVRFLVYGYMNRGIHEGEVGIAMYYYDSVINSIEEELYIPYKKSYNMLKQDIDCLSYVNSRGLFYLMLDGTVYSINMESKRAEGIETGLDENRFVASKDNSIIAWQTGKELSEYKTIRLFALNALVPVEITADEGGIIVPLGFMGQDFIYGAARMSDITTDASGRTIVPMYALRIQNIAGELLKEYRQDHIYILDVEITDKMIALNRVSKNEETGGYEAISEDQIMNNQSQEVTKNAYTSVVTDEMETTWQTVLAKTTSSDTIKLLTPREVIFEGSRALTLDVEDTVNRYYVYVKGDIAEIFADAADAVNRASEVFGVVINKNCSYIWESGNRKTKTQLEGIEEIQADESTSSTAICLDTMLKQEEIFKDTAALLNENTVLSVLENNLEATVLDLTGSSLNAVLYYVSRGYPVMVTVEGGESILIVGYDEKNTIIFDPREGTIAKKGMNDSKEWFEINGNQFMTYIK